MSHKQWQDKAAPGVCPRCAAHTLQDQLIENLEGLLKARQARINGAGDRADVDMALDADKSWSGQHKRLTQGG